MGGSIITIANIETITYFWGCTCGGVRNFANRNREWYYRFSRKNNLNHYNKKKGDSLWYCYRLMHGW